ncbi:transcriptional regulator, TetR family [Mycolicibacterium chubuense NBB4]|uniref:Transcriptional regulator, TetR family n=1 Tax=Mycolicibacterium chubuense (strain NBB4) TaxID=710421 RepID=I4BF96_MYCCN|nr:TetR/AcrR family transcriptional regulator C-terminal ligand-binding domain-containing protein [Mycolicibacterium chubuense]AFM15953.1 transcriptional regulator, TetR family [Mycolicibacterium chubuense NBB4]
MSDGDAAQRAKALDAALAELQQWGVDRFSIEGVAHRSQLSPDYLRRTWDSERQLILDALLSYSEAMITTPDTGSLRGDLTELALSLAAYLNNPVGRRIARMLVVDSKSQAIDSETRYTFWSLRRDTIDVIFRRAAQRKELRSDVRPTVALQLLTSPLHTFALYTNDPVDPDHCRAVADLVTRAICVVY